MRIRFTGPQVVKRIVGTYQWSQEVGFVQEVVETQLAAELLTGPRERFVVDESEPLCGLDGVDPQRAAELAVAGIGGIDDLAELDGVGIKRLAGEIWASERQVREWVKAVRSTLDESERADNTETEEV